MKDIQIHSIIDKIISKYMNEHYFPSLEFDLEEDLKDYMEHEEKDSSRLCKETPRNCYEDYHDSMVDEIRDAIIAVLPGEDDAN